MSKEIATELVSLSDTHRLRIADGDPDVRGWRVLSADRHDLGKVADVLVDPARMRVRYLVVTLDEFHTDAKDRRVLVPIGTATLDDVEDRVVLETASGDAVTQLPPYDGRPLTREFEDWLEGRLGEHPGKAATLYDREQFDDNRFYGTRRRIADTERRLRRHDNLEVERPLNDPVRSADVRTEVDADEIRVPIDPGEKVVVARSDDEGEIIIRKQAQEEAEERMRQRINDEHRGS
jgi:hypothetical protein